MSTEIVEHRRGTLKGGRSFDPAKFGTWLGKTREARGLKVTELADRCGLARGTIQRLENKAREGRAGDTPIVEVFVRLSEGLELDLGYVLHKAGYPVGMDGVNMDRVVRLEDTMRILDDAEPTIRSALAEAMHALGPGDGSNTLTRQEIQSLTGRALGALDLVTERLRAGRSST